MDLEEIQVSFPSENPNEEPQGTDDDETGMGETQNNFMKRLRSNWQAILIAILIVVTSILFTQITKHQNLTTKLQRMAENELKLKEFQIENNQLKQLLNSTQQNFTLLEREHGHLKQIMNTTLYNITLLCAENPQISLFWNNTSQEKTQLSLLLNNTLQEKTQLSLLLNNALQEKSRLSLLLNDTLQEKTQLNLLLKNTVQEKTQLEVENKKLNLFLNSTLEDCNLVEVEKQQLNLLLNQSLRNITLASAETKQLRLLLIDEQQTSKQLEAENQHQRSILLSSRLSFLWRFCDKRTLECSRCMPGWIEHASRCFHLSPGAKKWEDGRRECLHLGGDLAVVLNADDQAFLTNLTFQYVQQNPQVTFYSAWIGLQDMVKEGAYIWVNGNRLKSGVTYWKKLEPNNALASWDKSRAGQDCVAIVPPSQIGQKDWLNSWDDIVCGGKRHYLCETISLILS